MINLWNNFSYGTQALLTLIGIVGGLALLFFVALFAPYVILVVMACGAIVLCIGALYISLLDYFEKQKR